MKLSITQIRVPGEKTNSLFSMYDPKEDIILTPENCYIHIAYSYNEKQHELLQSLRKQFSSLGYTVVKSTEGIDLTKNTEFLLILKSGRIDSIKSILDEASLIHIIPVRPINSNEGRLHSEIAVRGFFRIPLDTPVQELSKEKLQNLRKYPKIKLNYEGIKL